MTPPPQWESCNIASTAGWSMRARSVDKQQIAAPALDYTIVHRRLPSRSSRTRRSAGIPNPTRWYSGVLRSVGQRNTVSTPTRTTMCDGGAQDLRAHAAVSFGGNDEEVRDVRVQLGFGSWVGDFFDDLHPDVADDAIVALGQPRRPRRVASQARAHPVGAPRRVCLRRFRRPAAARHETRIGARRARRRLAEAPDGLGAAGGARVVGLSMASFMR